MNAPTIEFPSPAIQQRRAEALLDRRMRAAAMLGRGIAPAFVLPWRREGR